MPRCAVKLVQALPLVATGAAARYGLSSIELALACASQLGLPEQLAGIRKWLDRAGLSESSLLCPPERPADRTAALLSAQAGEPPSRLHACNAGRHLALLTTAMHLGEPLEGYLDPAHPVQERVRNAVEAVAGVSLAQEPDGYDDCGMPAFGLSLRTIAGAMQRLSSGACLPAGMAEAGDCLLRAVASYPELLVGPGRCSTVSAQATGGEVIVKGGADGVYAGVDRRAGLGFSLKVADGNQHAADCALVALLTSLRFSLTDVFAAAACRQRRARDGRITGRMAWVGPTLTPSAKRNATSIQG